MVSKFEKALLPYWQQMNWLEEDGTFNTSKTMDVCQNLISTEVSDDIEIYDLIFNTLKYLKGTDQHLAYEIKSSGYFGSDKFRFIGSENNSTLINQLNIFLESSTGNPLQQLEQLFLLKKITPCFKDLGIEIKLETNLNSRNVSKIEKATLVPHESNGTNGTRFNFSFKASLDNGEIIAIQNADFFGNRGYLKIDKKYVIIPIEIRAAIYAQLKAFDLSPEDASNILINPTSFFPPETDLTKIDLKDYDERVSGFEIFKTNSIQEIVSSGVEWYPKEGNSTPHMTIQNQNGENISIPISEDYLKDLIVKIETSLKTSDELKLSESKAVKDANGNYILANDNNLNQLKIILQAVEKARKEPGQKDESGQRLHPTAVIKEISHDAVEGHLCPDLTATEISYFLNDDILLKPHQVEGINWLLKNYFKKQGGVILADDMGLGKTIQILAFMTIVKFKHLVPKIQAIPTETNESPSMVIAPLILLRNWEKENKKFIRPEFSGNVIILHGKELLSVQKSANGIDGDWYKSFNLIITNYSTFSRYQRSLLKINFNINVFDESQNIKNPDTAQTRAARGLKSQFCICATGTPVENRLLDLWPQVSTLNRKPHNPLGSLEQFLKIESTDAGTQFTRDRLSIGTSETTLLRRDKALLREQKVLKEKKVHDPITVEMNEYQVNQERIIIQEFKSKPLQILQNLQKLYQHPALLMKDSTNQSTKWYVENSPKLQITIELLKSIVERGEKVLVFTLWIDMQLILQKVLEEMFDLKVDIINGDTNSKQSSFNSAQTIIDKFSEKEGFNILILSPLAAGAGLNITAANNVIHYGRWWNPAKEDQGTDRAYRIGQLKDVNVYYPILTTKNGLGFDLKLHTEVLKVKRDLASDVLSPISKMDVNIKEEEVV